MPEITPIHLTIAFALQILFSAFFCYTLYKALLTVRSSNRSISPSSIWLLLIPGFSVIWNFKVVLSMASSLYKEFSDRNFDIKEQPGLRYGMIYAGITGFHFALVLAVPSFRIGAYILSFAALAFFVIYWVRINWYRKVLESDSPENEIPDPSS